MQNVLVAGSEGALGKFVIKALNQSGYQAIRAGRSVNNFENKTDIIYPGDLKDDTFVKNIFVNHSIDYVIHCAALWNGYNDDFEIVYNNIIVMLNVLRYSQNVKKFVMVSSSGVYENTELPYEDALLKPSSSYGISKLSCEKILTLRKPYTIWRPFHIVSPEEIYKEGSSHLLTNLSHKYIDNKQHIQLNSINGTKAISFTWVEDVASCIVNHLEDSRTENEIFNLASEDQASVKAAAELFVINAQEVGLLPKFAVSQSPRQEFKSDGRFNKIYEILGWTAQTSFPDCIKKFLQYKYGIRTRKIN